MKTLLMALAFVGALLLSWTAIADTNVKPGQVYPIAPVATACCTLTSGGAAQNFQNATSAGNSGQSPVSCLIKNPTTATEQGIATAEAIWVNVVGTAAAAAGGTSIPMEPGDGLVFYPATNALSWIAATTGHKIAGYCWQ